MTYYERAVQLRPFIEKSVGIALTDNEALEAVELFSHWKNDGVYAAGDRVQYNGVLYKCLTGHTAQEAWNPVDAASLWAKVLIPDPDVIPEWEQPESTNPYKKGDKVTHNGKTWISDIDYNTWEPGVYGWSEVA